MLSYKMKNYVLLDPGGKLLIKGSGLRSRGIELFQRQWMEEMFRLLLTGRRDEISALNRRWEEDFVARRVPVRQFMKTETLQESLGAYREKVAAGTRNAGAAYELALRAERPYQAGDQVSYYVTGDSLRIKVNEAAKLAVAWDPSAPDENTAYYVGKLRELAEKFLPFMEREGLAVVVEEPEESEESPGPVQASLDLGL
jgi:DNA polymerase elongation subunit (family B)